MTNPASTMLTAAPLQKKEPRVFEFLITLASGVPSLNASMLGYPVLFGVASGTPLDQAGVDAFLGISGDITAATSFGATAMGVDSIGFVINMQGQAASAVWAEAVLYDTTRIFRLVAGAGTVTTALPNTLTEGFAVTPGGNLYGRLIPTGTDASSNLLAIKYSCYLKPA